MTSKTILIVDDDTSMLESTEFLLTSEGYNVITAKNGNEAVAKYKSDKPNIIFMDIRMPHSDGFEAFHKIKEYDKKAKIVLTSAYAVDNEQYEKAKRGTLSDFLVKPFKIEEMIRMIKKYMN